MKRKILSAFAAAFLLGALTGCSGGSDNSLVVLNYGKYLDPEMLELFEEETGIHVEYEEYESPEEMYTKYKARSEERRVGKECP